MSPDRSLVTTDHGVEVDEAVLDAYGLNKGQKEAFRRLARFGPLGLLQGPPGTGKTLFIAAFTHWLVTRQGASRILIASQSHEAVNNVIEALVDLFRRLGGRPSLLRIGAKGITDKIRPYHTDAVRERYQARFDAAFKHRVSGLGGAVGLRRSFVGDAVEIDRQLGERVRHLATLAVAPHPSREGRGARDRLSDGSAWKTAHDAYVEAGLSVLGREVDPDKPEEELEAAFEGLLTKHPGTSPSDVAKIRRIIELSREWSASLASSHRNFEEFLAKTRTIVTATCVGAGQTKIRIDAKNYDWVIVDEAARCTPGELAVPIQVGRRVLLVGDHRQLLPMIDRDVMHALRREMPETAPAELARSDFERAFLSSYGRENGRTLTEQYRMAPAICDLVSKVFYEPDGVRLMPSKDRRANPLFERTWPGALARPVAWVDTSREAHRFERPADWSATTFWNQAEVDAVLKLLERISEQQDLVAGLASEGDQTPVGVICMYSAQKLKIEQAFMQRPWEPRFRRLVRIDTVDSYQGKENAVVIVSLVRNNRTGDPGHVRTPNRCNVALSRAKERLLIVGARTMWTGMPARQPMRRVIEHVDGDNDGCHTVQAGQV